MECRKIEEKGVEVCTVRGYISFASEQSLLAVEDREVVEALMKWLDVYGVSVEQNVVITDGVEAYTARVPGAINTIIYRVPNAKKVAYDFIKYLEETGREEWINPKLAARLELELGIVYVKNLEERIKYLKRASGEPAAASTPAMPEDGSEAVKSEETAATASTSHGEKAGGIEEETTAAGGSITIEEVCRVARILSESYGADAVYKYLLKAKDNPVLLQTLFA